MSITFTVVVELWKLLFPVSVDDLWLETVELSVLARLARAPQRRAGNTVIAPLPYEHSLVREAVHAAKYRGHVRATELLAESLAPHLAEELGERRMLGTFYEPLLIPIPLHETRMRERGFNQTERIASVLVRSLPDSKLNICLTALTRVRDTAHQARIRSKQARFANMNGAFIVTDPARVVDRYVILLDDVFTTGATLFSAREALLVAGARDVLCVAVAH
jgi:competence protein ComFC